MLNVQIKGMFPKKEYRSELIIDCNGKIEREYCLVHEDTKEQKSYFSFACGIVCRGQFYHRLIIYSLYTTYGFTMPS